MTTTTMIHPFLQRADTNLLTEYETGADSSLPAKGRLITRLSALAPSRFIPSCEGQAVNVKEHVEYNSIHPFLRRAGALFIPFNCLLLDSSLPAKGRHSVFMRLSAALNTSLCNLHKCHSWLIHIFNMPKNPPHFHFFSNYFFCFSTPITRDIPAPYDLDRPTPFLIKFRNAFASLTRSRNSYPNTLTG